MFIERLRINKGNIEENIRDISFSLGTNFIVDVGNEGKGNNVGKTTTLRVIDVCLGANEIKNLYTDAETKSENVDLKKFLIENKVYAILTVVNHFDEEDKVSHDLKVDLFPRGKKYINNIRYNSINYTDELKKMFFDDDNLTLSFRQLIKKFVRIDLKGDNDRFLKFLHPITKNSDYVNIYSTLFKFNNSKNNEEMHQLIEEIKSIDSDIKNHRRLRSYHDENELFQRLTTIQQKINKLIKELDILVNSQEFKLNEKEIYDVRFEYQKLLNDLEKITFEIDRAEQIIVDTENDNVDVDQDVLLVLYKETQSIYENLTKDFFQLIEFNEQLINNKLSFYRKLLEEKKLESHTIKSEIEKLFNENKNAILLIDSDNVEKYYALQKELSEYQESMGRVKETYETLKESEGKKLVLQNNLDNIDTDKNMIDDRITYFNHKFSEYSSLLSGEEYILYPVDGYNKFPLGVSGSKNGTFSTGTKKSTIVAFDLAYINYAEHYDIKTPNFIIHDVLESMDEEAFRRLIDIMESMSAQYIVAVLKEKIDTYDFIKESMIKLKLSIDNKLFKV